MGKPRRRNATRRPMSANLPPVIDAPHADDYQDSAERAWVAENRPERVPAEPRAVAALSPAARSEVERLRGLQAIAQKAETDSAAVVATLREAGASWASIGWVVGMTAEGARRRWGR